MDKYFIIKNFTLDSYYGYNGQWDDDIRMVMTFTTKEEAVNYGKDHALGLCVIIEFYNF